MRKSVDVVFVLLSCDFGGCLVGRDWRLRSQLRKDLADENSHCNRPIHHPDIGLFCHGFARYDSASGIAVGRML
jgi:hypothetical protein